MMLNRRLLVVVVAALLGSLPAAGPRASAAATPVPTAPACPMLPDNNVWNADISTLPVHARSNAWLSTMGGGARHIHPDFGSSGDPSAPYGIPYTVVGNAHPQVNVAFDYASESDAGPYPLGADTPIEGGTAATGDRHALIVNSDTCTLYELYNARYNAGASTAGSGAIFDLRGNALRPDTWTSVDAAGLPILPGLLRPDEVSGGNVTHAIRVTAAVTDTSHLWPARHDAGSRSDANLPPMGARFRLKAGVDISHFSAQTQTVLRAFQHFGLILADNGSNWYFSGSADNNWDPTLISELKSITAGSFEAVDESSLMTDPNSGATRSTSTPPLGAVVMDASGPLHVAGTGGPSIGGAPSWPGWAIARGVAVCRGPGGYVLDGYGGVHPFGGAPNSGPAAYWPNWDIARAIAVRPQGGGYVLDGFGGVHAFGGAPVPRISAYWPNWDIANSLAVNPDGNSGYVLDGFGGLHPFAVGSAPMPAIPAVTGYWRGWDIARGVEIGGQGSGYVLDGFGGVHPFGGAPPAALSGYWPGHDIATGLIVTSASGGYVLETSGQLHAFGSAPPAPPTPGEPVSLGARSVSI